MNSTTWPKPATEADNDEGDRQLLLLAIAELSLRRPGWNWTLGRLAERLSGREMFEEFKKTSEGIVKPDTLVQCAAVLEKIADSVEAVVGKKPADALRREAALWRAGHVGPVDMPPTPQPSPCTCIGSYCARRDPEYPQAGPCWDNEVCRRP